MKRKRHPLSVEDQLYAKEQIEKYDPTIRKVIGTYLSKDLDSEFEDIVQDVYETICCQLDDFRTYSAPRALVVKITQRAVWKYFRRQQKYKDKEAPLEENLDYPAAEEDRGLEDILPFKLSPDDRQILIRTYQNMDTSMEVAADLGEKPATIRRRVNRARERLKKLLGNF